MDIDHKKIVRRLNPDAPEEEAMEPDNDIILIQGSHLGSMLKGLDGNEGEKERRGRRKDGVLL